MEEITQRKLRKKRDRNSALLAIKESIHSFWLAHSCISCSKSKILQRPTMKYGQSKQLCSLEKYLAHKRNFSKVPVLMTPLMRSLHCCETHGSNLDAIFYFLNLTCRINHFQDTPKVKPLCQVTQ